MEPEPKISCSNFPSDTTSSSQSIYKVPKKSEEECPPSCLSHLTTSSSTTSSISSQYFREPCRLHKQTRDDPPNIKYELAIAKSVLKKYSTLSGDNLFDHLSDIIKRVIDERPPNVIDFFEEFSRNVREQKFHLPERFAPDAVFEEIRWFRIAKKILMSMRLPYPDIFPQTEDMGEELEEEKILDLKLDLQDNLSMFKIFNERVQQFQFYWNQCGFSISSDDIFQLACSMDRLQNHPSISHCRFWGSINGLKGSYFIVEALLTNSEKNSRIAMAEDEIRQKTAQDLITLRGDRKNMFSSLIGPELIPGNFGWEHWPPEDLARMRPAAEQVPVIEIPDIFDMPAEPVGSGVNRFSYFVVTNLADDWIELPIANPKQIYLSRQIKKFFTGDLESEVVSYPCFPGKEKHLLRSIIARITSGTYIAPRAYYRKMTKRERRIFEGNELDLEDEAEEEEEESLEGEEDFEIDNNIVLLYNEAYEPEPLTALASTANWQHVRPNILNQGRVVYFDLEKARKEREKELARLLKLQLAGENEEELMEEDNDEDIDDGEGEDEESEFMEMRESGPPILNPCHLDENAEGPVSWTPRFTSTYTNQNERVLVMQSNIWPGAYSFTFDKISESIYVGWGHKYISRNIPFVHLPQVAEQYPHTSEDFAESSDPSVEEEEAYRLYLLEKQRRLEARNDFNDAVEEGFLDDVETFAEDT